MVAFNFSPEFADDVAAGRKLQTIRQNKRAKVGDRLQLYTGQRTKTCRLLREAICTCVDYVGIDPSGLTFGDVRKHPDTMDEFARADGFADYATMLAWFERCYGSPFFIGYVHKWSAEHAPSRTEG